MLTCPAVHIPTRSLLRSSSTPEPSDPLCSVVFHFSIFSPSEMKKLSKIDSLLFEFTSLGSERETMATRAATTRTPQLFFSPLGKERKRAQKGHAEGQDGRDLTVKPKFRHPRAICFFPSLGRERETESTRNKHVPPRDKVQFLFQNKKVLKNR